MALRELSTEKREILDSPESGVVAAGAGSGKTTLLARAVYEDVQLRRVPLDRVMVVVFNNAAAAHLVDRIQSEFTEGRDASEPSIDLSAAWIGTFHGICSRIVGERALSVGIAPDPVVLDEMESRVLAELALDQATETCDHPDLLLMLSGITDARGAARRVLDGQRAAGIADPKVPIPQPGPYDPAQLVSAASAVLEFPGMTAPRCKTAQSALDALAAGTWRGMKPIGGKPAAAFASVLGAYDDAVRATSQALIDRAALPLLEAFAAFFEAFRHAYARLKRERGALDFEDLQLFTGEILRTDPAAAAAYRFDRVYIDEAQDVNPLQDELIAAFSQSAERVLRVGDEQQSIYRFRWADIECFRKAADRTNAFPLRQNYRSQAEVLDPLNGWLTPILSQYEALEVRADPEPVATPAVELVVVENPAGRTSRLAEAAEVARNVHRLHHENGFEWGDVVVLFRARTGIDLYERALRAAGVPTVMIGGNVFAEHEQVADVLSLLSLVENPHDEEHLVRVLASPYVAASDDELLALRLAAGEKAPLWDAVPRVPSLEEFARELEDFRTRRRQLDLPSLVEAAISFRGYELAALGMNEGASRYANLRRLVKLAGQFGMVRGADVREFLRFMQRAVDLGADPGEAVVVDDSLDAVRLMTVHAAKGQEFGAVVVADAANPGGGSQPSVLLSQSGNTVGARCSPDGLDAVRAFSFDALCAEDNALGSDEERRISYVALTRAKRHLTVVGRAVIDKSGERGWPGPMSWLAGTLEETDMPALGQESDVPLANGSNLHLRSVEADDERLTDVRAIPELSAVGAVPHPRPVGELDSRRGIHVSYSALELHRVCSLRYHLEVDLGLSQTDRVISSGHTTPPAGAGNQAFGIRFHEAMEQVDWRNPTFHWPDERAQRLFRVVAESPIGRRLAAAQEIHLERPFLIQVDGAIVEGVADVWALEPDGTVLLVDWKTGIRHGIDDPGYKLQQATYALAALQSGAETVETAWCFLELDAAIDARAATTADVDALEHQLHTAVAAVGSDPAPAVTEPAPLCSRCPGLKLGCPAGQLRAS